MGAGKTTLGKVLAQKMGLTFYDLDEYIEDRSSDNSADFRRIRRKRIPRSGTTHAP